MIFFFFCMVWESAPNYKLVEWSVWRGGRQVVIITLHLRNLAIRVKHYKCSKAFNAAKHRLEYDEDLGTKKLAGNSSRQEVLLAQREIGSSTLSH
jgi:hypothetical protein